MNISQQIIDEIMSDDNRAFLDVLQEQGISFEYLVMFGVDSVRKGFLERLKRTTEIKKMLVEDCRQKADAAQKFLDEEASRIYTTPVTPDEAIDARKKRGVGDVADSNRQKKYGNRYMSTFNAWILRLSEERGARCQVCGNEKDKSFTVHHRHYRTLGQETSADLALACKKCHAVYHDLYKGKGLTPQYLVMIDRENEYWRNKLVGNLEIAISEFEKESARKIDNLMILSAALAAHDLDWVTFEKLRQAKDAAPC